MKRATIKEISRLLAATAIGFTTATAADQAGVVTSHPQGLHGYIRFGHEKLPAGGGYSAGMGFMPPPRRGKLASLDPGLFVTPPKGMEASYVPIVTRQEKAP